MGQTTKLALSGVDLNVQDGEFVCLLGPSGCGKMTLLNIPGGLEPDFEGSVRFFGSDPRRGYMFQEPRLLHWLRVRDNLRFVLSRRVDEVVIEGWWESGGVCEGRYAQVANPSTWLGLR